jgi:dTDP-4-amino-4,6-dideoxygalactose transaminase
MIPYTQHTIYQDDIDAVSKALSDGDLATGRIVEQYEAEFASAHGYAHGVAVSSGTAALWCAYKALGLQQGDEVITSPLTFAATANMIVAVGATPVFADVDAGTFNITQRTVAEKVTGRTRAIVPVDLGGAIADTGKNVKPPAGLCYADRSSAPRHRVSGIPVVVDAAHSAGIAASVGVMRCYSTHASKNMTTCEGGMVLTDDKSLASEMRTLRNHGVDSTPRTRKSHQYQMKILGFNFRLPDPLAALGISQLCKLSRFNMARALVRTQYDTAFMGEPGIILRKGSVPTSNHLYMILLDLDALKYDRDQIFKKLRKADVGVNVHYRPVYLFRAYHHMGYKPGLCPNAEWVYERLLTLPLYPTMEQWKVEYVISTVKSVVKGYLK